MTDNTKNAKIPQDIKCKNSIKYPLNRAMKLNRFTKYLIVFLLILLSTTTLNYTTFVRAQEPPQVQITHPKPTPLLPKIFLMSKLPIRARRVKTRIENPNFPLDPGSPITKIFL